MNDEQMGRKFREAWIAGVREHFPGEPKPGYVATWEEMGDWEKQAAIAVYKRTAAFINAAGAPSDEQGGRYVSEAWNVEMFRRIEKPKPSYTSDWEALPDWQRKTDVGIFRAIKAALAGS